MNRETMLVWHQQLCPACRRYRKCPEWWDILREFTTAGPAEPAGRQAVA